LEENSQQLPGDHLVNSIQIAVDDAIDVLSRRLDRLPYHLTRYRIIPFLDS